MILIDIGISRVDDTSVAVQQVIDECSDIGNAEHMITVHVTKHDFWFILNDLEAEGKIVNVKCEEISTTVTSEVV